ncbi:23S rRNA (adenine(2503)-C(2))-methyltransferase RlmN [Buchnera aphidicola (Pemphigus obesinymphae)]|uniref:23S rRNA (adenine(2503)-C(2))-methyltransferase RlmN n=1 Tax=Buchnera aphidicola TaxID=9 RepID=UPI002238A2F7|nr:23S rRNA (adenine(2503)-C(2))-methyltransferase RlmN [Buchnera aphidicola (Pemphigus obesinymphae)]
MDNNLHQFENIDNKINLLNLHYHKMCNFFLSIGEKKFCADQMMNWIYREYCDDFDKMTNISKVLRKKLKNICVIKAPRFVEENLSVDGTIKWKAAVNNNLIETVYIPEKNRSTLCVSTQIGCILGCKFCSTGQIKFRGNLKVSEIVGQIWNAIRRIRFNQSKKKRPVTNIVFMGMGEPLLNLKNVVNSLKIILNNFGFNISKNKVTISTAGIVPALNKLSSMIDVNLAVSLHAPNDLIRNQIMSINKKYNIQNLLRAVNRYLSVSKANRGGVTIEYVMLDHVNDEIIHAEELALLLKETPSKINLIPWNVFPNSIYKSSHPKRIEKFASILTKKGFFTIIRKNRGTDINAACGQLIGKIV